MVTPSGHLGGSSCHLPIVLAWIPADLSGADGDSCLVTSRGWGLVLLGTERARSLGPMRLPHSRAPWRHRPPSWFLQNLPKGTVACLPPPSRLPPVPAPGLLSRWTVSPREGLCPSLRSERLQARGCRWRPRDMFGWASVPRGSQVPARQLCREPSPGPGLVDSEGEGRHDLGRAEWCGRSRRSPPWGQQGWADEEDPALHHQAPCPTQEPSPASLLRTAWPSLGGGWQGGTHRQRS